MTAPRAELARKLVEYELPIDDVVAELARYPWDCESPLFAITRFHVESILDRYLSGELTAQQVGCWADLVEVRDDLDAEEDAYESIRAVINELANPDLTEPLSKDSALRMRQSMTTQTI